jgi:hypothetical protein
VASGKKLSHQKRKVHRCRQCCHLILSLPSMLRSVSVFVFVFISVEIDETQFGS